MKTGFKIGLAMLVFIISMFFLFLLIWSFIVWNFQPFADLWNYAYTSGWITLRYTFAICVLVFLISIVAGIIEEKN
jgi:hypothetical protein